jgi:hypothetical protein
VEEVEDSVGWWQDAVLIQILPPDAGSIKKSFIKFLSDKKEKK